MGTVLSRFVFGILLGVFVISCGEGITADPTGQVEEQNLALNGACYVNSIVFGAWYSQRDSRWSSILLGNSSSETIGSAGCVITSLSMAYNDVWRMPTTPSQLNSSAKAAGCFAKGSPYVDVSCAINSRGGPHAVTSIAMT
jgi:hypothetical protein